MTSKNDHASIEANFKRAKVLVIEDSDDHWVLIKEAMRQCLVEVTPERVATALEAQELLTEWQRQEWEIPKLILLDLYIPERENGLQLLKQIKAMPAPCNQVPIVMFSSSSNPADITEAYQLGVSSYLVKPVSFNEWFTYFTELRTYWWETVTLPPIQYLF